GLHPVLLLQPALPEGRRPARRDREARSRVGGRGHRPRHGREAREVVRPVERDDGLAARGGADPEDAGLRLRDQADQVRRLACEARQGPPDPVPAHGEGRERGAQPAQARPRAGPPGRTRARPGRARARQARPRVRRRVARGDLRAGRCRAASVATGHRGGTESVSTTETPLKRVAYCKGCLASPSAKELDTSTKALAPLVGMELIELESVTCCGAGDIHEAEPDYYVHLNARILAYAEATGCDTLLTVCNVCTLNLRQA